MAYHVRHDIDDKALNDLMKFQQESVTAINRRRDHAAEGIDSEMMRFRQMLNNRGRPQGRGH